MLYLIIGAIVHFSKMLFLIIGAIVRFSIMIVYHKGVLSSLWSLLLHKNFSTSTPVSFLREEHMNQSLLLGKNITEIHTFRSPDEGLMLE